MIRKLLFGLMLLALVALAACRPVDLPGDNPPASGDEAATPTPKPDDATSGKSTPGATEPPAGDSGEGRPFAPQPGDSALTRDQAYVNESELIIAESFPPQIFLRLSGALPTPCHQLRVAVGQPDAQGQIQIDVYSVVDPDRVCAQVLKDFNENVPLGSFPSGKYSVWVNGTMVGEFTS